ncbi:MAG: hypothetical protein LBM72_02450 [Mycoplasmataceae bacterium]|jgi:hypothetical protein|nr:hypothetical protein [Mycoplasmataceae bacterium]
MAPEKQYTTPPYENKSNDPLMLSDINTYFTWGMAYDCLINTLIVELFGTYDYMCQVQNDVKLSAQITEFKYYASSLVWEFSFTVKADAPKLNLNNAIWKLKTIAPAPILEFYMGNSWAQQTNIPSMYAGNEDGQNCYYQELSFNGQSSTSWYNGYVFDLNNKEWTAVTLPELQE